MFFDVDGFLFYVLTDGQPSRDHVLGFFSKEKFSYDGYNLACIVILPPYQSEGYGKVRCFGLAESCSWVLRHSRGLPRPYSPELTPHSSSSSSRTSSTDANEPRARRPGRPNDR